MNPREPSASDDKFDPRPLEALQQELRERVGEDRPFTVESWEFDTAPRVERKPRAGLAAWMWRGALAAGVLGAAAGAVTVPELAGREAPAAAPTPVAQTSAPPPLGQPRLGMLVAQAPEKAPAAEPGRPAADDDPAPTAAERSTPAQGPEADDEPLPAPAPDAPDVVALPPPDANPEPRGPGRDCKRPLSAAEELACDNPDLAAKDRELGRALRRAMAAGVPDARLRREHARWARARDEAAYDAPWRLPEIYDRRIEELRAEADAAEAGEY